MTIDSAPAPTETPAAPAETPAAPAQTPGTAGETPAAPYALSAPPGEAFDAPALEAFSGLAQELGIPQDAGQRILDTLAEYERAHLERLSQGFEQATRADPDIGGERLEQSLSAARRALDAFGNDALRDMLAETGLGNHPELVRFMTRAGQAIGEDRVVAGQSPARPERSLADRLYPST